MNRLYERTAELAVIDEAVLALSRGRGSALLIEARAGRGKSSLVEYAVARARDGGARILLARARHLESAAPYEVLRRLLGPAVEESGGAAALTGSAAFAAPLFTPGAALAQGVDYGCQWLIAALAEQSPLVLAVDDAHWADAASLRVLLEVLAEISVQPILLLLASRPVENADAQRRLATMAAQPECVVLAPEPLSREGVEAVVVETLGEPVHASFLDECVKVTGGNAFYLHELLRPYRTGFRRDQQTFVKDGSMSLGRTVSWRLGELGADATDLARAAAVLGDGCSLHVAARLAGLDDATAAVTAARLEAASVFACGDPVDFVHPLIRAAVEETMPAVAVGQLHARAARTLRRQGAPAAEVVQHLVESPGSGDPEVAAYLAERGSAALETGSVAEAAAVLRRALDEPPPPAERPHLMVELARAERSLGELESARERLEQVLGGADRDASLEAAAELFDVLYDAGEFTRLASLHQQTSRLRPTGTTDVELRIRAQLLSNVVLAPDTSLRELPEGVTAASAATLAADRGIERYLLVITAVYERTTHPEASDRLVAELGRATAGLPTAGNLSDWDVWTVLTAAQYLADVDLDGTDALLEQITADVARLRGRSPTMQAELDHRKALSRMRRGHFEDALSVVDRAQAFSRRRGLVGYEGAYTFTRAWIAFERGDYVLAAQLFADRVADDHVYPALGLVLGGHPVEAVALLAEFEFDSAPDADVRPLEVELEPHLVASHAYELAGERDLAAREAAREVAIRRRYGPDFRLALALRRQASFLPARQALPDLEEAVRLAAVSGRRPVEARVLASYGVACRHAGDLVAAREVLYRALDGATRIGMRRLAERVRRELSLAGARPRRSRSTGLTALTESQHQVAILAVEGRTNREIAEELYVTIKTVEAHLAAVYRKLGIGGRDELAGHLPLASAVSEGAEPTPVP